MQEDRRFDSEIIIDEEQPLQVQDETLPSIPYKLYTTALLLTFLGLLLIVFGILIQSDSSQNKDGGKILWLIGVMLLIPGVFYGVRLVIAYRSKDVHLRNEILANIPI